MVDKIKVFMKKKNNRIIIVILILGIMLMLMPGGDEDGGIYETDEKRIEEILDSVEGIGDVSVYISYKEEGNFSSSEKKAVSAVVVANDINSYIGRTAKEVVSNITGIPHHKVMVLKNKNGGK